MSHEFDLTLYLVPFKRTDISWSSVETKPLLLEQAPSGASKNWPLPFVNLDVPGYVDVPPISVQFGIGLPIFCPFVTSFRISSCGSMLLDAIALLF